MTTDTDASDVAESMDPTGEFSEGDELTVELPLDVWGDIQDKHPDCPQTVPAVVIDTDGEGHDPAAVPVMCMLPDDDHHLDAFLPGRLSKGLDGYA